jgi:hypothetical protein
LLDYQLKFDSVSHISPKENVMTTALSHFRPALVVAHLSLSVVFVLALAATAHGDTIYDPAAAFEQGWTTGCNPNGVWSYGYSSGVTDPVTLYDQTVQNGVNGPQAQYWLSSAVNIRTSPATEFNNGPAYDDGNIDFLANQLVLVAGIGGQYSDLIFTAPASGIYSIAGDFRGDQYGIGTAVGITANGKILFNSSVTAEGQTVPFGTEVSLNAGDMVVFSAGSNGGLQNTGLSATMTPVPEPGMLVLLATCLVGLLAYAWQQHGAKGRQP